MRLYQSILVTHDCLSFEVLPRFRKLIFTFGLKAVSGNSRKRRTGAIIIWAILKAINMIVVVGVTCSAPSTPTGEGELRLYSLGL